MPFDPAFHESEPDVPPSEIAARHKVAQQWITLDTQQAAALFRLHVTRPLGGCQYEQGRMRWWLAQGLRIELSDAGEWTLWVVPTRGLPVAPASRDSQQTTTEETNS